MLRSRPSSDITQEWREYERTSTVVLNAYVQPVASCLSASRSTDDLRVLRDAGPRLDVMKSNGGTATFAVSEELPIHMVESGPVGGVIGAAADRQRRSTSPNMITLDIGGTTAKCSLIDHGEVKITTEYRIERDQHSAGYPIKAPVVDIVEIGAGGGSIAWIDAGGALKVGPKSAGAVPGPACYGQGGTEPTVTDANLIAGRINPNYFLGGEIAVSVDLAKQAMQKIADALGRLSRGSGARGYPDRKRQHDQRPEAGFGPSWLRPARFHNDGLRWRWRHACCRTGHRASRRHGHHSPGSGSLLCLGHAND